MSSSRSGRARRISHYRLGELIGRGGMGAVYRATDVRSQTTVAIKTLHEHLGDDPAFRDRFLREAHFGSLLTSPYTARLLDYGEHEGTHYIVMEMVEGRTVKEMLAGGALPTRQALDLGRQSALALEEAETKGLIHRDIKPENIRVTDAGRVKVLDFGITRRLHGGTLTVPGAFIGTPTYAAPETFRGKTDHRSDIYSLGATLFHMLTGRPPFTAETATEMIRQHELDPPPIELLKGRPEIVIQIVARCLEKDPDRRFQKASDLATALEEAMTAPAPAAAGEETRVAPAADATAADATAATEVAGPDRPTEAIGAGEGATVARTAGPTVAQTGATEAAAAPAGPVTITMELLPSRGAGRMGGAYVLNLRNPGDTPTVVNLAVSDPGAECDVTLPASASVPPKGNARVPLRVSPRQRRWRGAKKEHAFTVTAQGGDGGGQPPLSASGLFDDVPLFSGWVGWASLGGGASLAIGVIVAIIAVMLGGGGDGNGGDGPTEDDLLSDLAAVEVAFNDGDFGRLYDDFITASCQRGISQDEFSSQLEEGVGDLGDYTLTIDDVSNIRIDGDTATFDFDSTITIAGEAESSTTTDDTARYEDGHFRFTDCLGAGEGVDGPTATPERMGRIRTQEPAQTGTPAPATATPPPAATAAPPPPPTATPPPGVTLPDSVFYNILDVFVVDTAQFQSFFGFGAPSGFDIIGVDFEVTFSGPPGCQADWVSDDVFFGPGGQAPGELFILSDEGVSPLVASFGIAAQTTLLNCESPAAGTWYFFVDQIAFDLELHHPDFDPIFLAASISELF